jgi:hypothetical protein
VFISLRAVLRFMPIAFSFYKVLTLACTEALLLFLLLDLAAALKILVLAVATLRAHLT